ncbi:hypothetical protein C8R45DRAFT_1006973 [Mycena sanguinolenta]|nr:hypothetical protein C8R45DRAFT_1006973 [Mycena sanguinolenta]
MPIAYSYSAPTTTQKRMILELRPDAPSTRSPRAHSLRRLRPQLRPHHPPRRPRSHPIPPWALTRVGAAAAPAQLLRLLFVCTRASTHARCVRPRFRSVRDVASTSCWGEDSRPSTTPTDSLLRCTHAWAREARAVEFMSDSSTCGRPCSSSPYVLALGCPLSPR